MHTNIFTLAHSLTHTPLSHQAFEKQTQAQKQTQTLVLFLSPLQPGTQTGGNLKPVILPEILEAQRALVRRVVCEESTGPREHLRLYDKYAPLVSKQAEEDVEQFLHEKHSFQEMMMEVTRYQQMVDDIQYNSTKVRFAHIPHCVTGQLAPQCVSEIGFCHSISSCNKFSS